MVLATIYGKTVSLTDKEEMPCPYRHFFLIAVREVWLREVKKKVRIVVISLGIILSASLPTQRYGSSPA